MLANLSYLYLVLAWQALARTISDYSTANACADKTDIIVIDTFAHVLARLKGT